MLRDPLLVQIQALLGCLAFWWLVLQAWTRVRRTRAAAPPTPEQEGESE